MGAMPAKEDSKFRGDLKTRTQHSGLSTQHFLGGVAISPFRLCVREVQEVKLSK